MDFFPELRSSPVYLDRDGYAIDHVPIPVVLPGYSGSGKRLSSALSAGAPAPERPCVRGSCSCAFVAVLVVDGMTKCRGVAVQKRSVERRDGQRTKLHG